ncbi:M20/M25/M40 family metallo-hydrolase [Paenibacillus taichungensis]|uniref:M20/M25/M40 family metallo-hydrolase n=1 Tax=Paenibacillus taichungensis TaxID=484184 RepID=UPI002871B78E|nr:M20/M25/M40 family metallo-hydrolase [Paenibacillus taichungensis]MDR9746872.1 M20/M25/M40 family metallo-hydrolase [Paenibacillus taichungensis]
MIKQQRVIDHFMELVQIDSETTHEQNISKVLKEQFTQLGLSVYEDDTVEKTGHGAGNLVITWEAEGAEEAAPIFFTCHMDTVTPGQEIKPELGEDGWIRSDGTTILGADDKAGIAALFEAIRAIQENNLPHGKIQFVITVGEESGLVGARAMNPKDIEAEFGYALDSNGAVGTICVAAPARAEIQMKIYGKSAHAGVNPEDGISAIQVAAKAIAAMKLGRIDDETTANIGKFQGGSALNVVCDFVQIEAEARSIVQEKVELQVAQMREALETTCRKYGATAEFRSEILYPAFGFHDEHEVVQLAQRAIRSLGLETSTFASGGGSDANIFNGFNIPTVNLAVGYEDIHTTKERIRAEDIVKLAEVVVAIIQETAASKK